MQIAHKKRGCGIVKTIGQSLTAQLVDELPFGPSFECVETLAEQELAALLELADGSQLRTLQAGDELVFGPMAAQHAVVETDLFLRQKSPVGRFEFLGLGRGSTTWLSCTTTALVTYIVRQVRCPLELPDSKQAVHLAAGIGALGADLFMSVSQKQKRVGEGEHTERRKVRVMFQNMYRRSAVLACVLSNVVAIW